MIQGILDFVIKIIDAIPFLRGWKTVIALVALGVIGTLDKVGVTTGLYDQVAPVLWPITTALALAHKPSDERNP